MLLRGAVDEAIYCNKKQIATLRSHDDKKGFDVRADLVKVSGEQSKLLGNFKP